MRSSSLFAPVLATLAAAQSSVSVVVTDGITSTIVLPGWPSGSSSSGAASSPTGSVEPSVTITVVGGTTSGVSIAPTTLTVVPSAIPPNSTFGPGPFGLSTSGSASPTTTLAVVTSTPSNGTNTTAPTTVPTAAADRSAALDGSVAGMVMFCALSLLML